LAHIVFVHSVRTPGAAAVDVQDRRTRCSAREIQAVSLQIALHCPESAAKR
jgi:hypothetical protein